VLHSSNASLPVEKKAVEPFDITLSFLSKFNGANIGGDDVEVTPSSPSPHAFLQVQRSVYLPDKLGGSSMAKGNKSQVLRKHRHLIEITIVAE
jgi:hypothetical protein